MELIKIRKRVFSSNRGIEELENLIDSFECKLEGDINTIVSKSFYLRAETDNNLLSNDFNYRCWENTVGFWKIKNGNLFLVSKNDCGYENYNFAIKNIIQVDFSSLLDSLEMIISLYNVKCKEKDEQISKFIKFCDEYLRGIKS